MIPLRLDRSRQRWKERVSFRFRKETLTRIINIGDISWKENTWMTRDCRKKKRKNDLMENQYPIVSSPTDLELPLPPSRPLNFYQCIEIVYENISRKIPIRVCGTISPTPPLPPPSFHFQLRSTSLPSLTPFHRYRHRVSQLERGGRGLINRPEQMIHWRGGTVSSSPR